MTQLKYLGIEYPDRVENMEVLTRMHWLEEILLYAIPEENLECLKRLPKHIKVIME